MGDSRESTLQEFEDDTSLEVVANRPGKCAATRKWTGCRNWPTSTFAVQQGKMQSPAVQEHRLGANKQKGGRKSRERPEIPAGHQVDHEPPKHLYSKQGQQLVGCIRKKKIQ